MIISNHVVIFTCVGQQLTYKFGEIKLRVKQ